MTKHISCDCKCKFNSATCNSNQKLNTQTFPCEYKNYRKCKKVIVGTLATTLVGMISI